MQAIIDDEVEVEADSEEEAITNAEQDWSFVEGKEWKSEVIESPEEEEDD